MKDIETVVRDANGEVLEVGDIVITPGGGAAIISRFYFDRGDYWIAKSDGSRDQPSWEVTKATTLTHDQYVPLARRTMDPDLMGDHPAARKARLLYLMTGVFDEYNEFFIASEFDGAKEFILDEAGDVIWYAEQLAEEVEVVEGLEVLNVSKFPPFFVLNHIKKAAVHQREESIKFIGECLEEILREVSQSIEHLGSSVGEIRLANIRKLMGRYPDGFVMGGGKR